MISRETVVLDAAIAVLADGGSRALTHRAVDRAASLPPGSTSNLFRSRAALLAGVLEHMADQELAQVAAVQSGVQHRRTSMPTGGSREAQIDQLAELVGAMIGFALGPGRALTLARHAVFAEVAAAGGSPALERTTRRLWQVAARLLRAAGSTAPQRDARRMLAYVDGLVTDQLVRPQRRFDAAVAVRPLLTGLLPADPCSEPAVDQHP